MGGAPTREYTEALQEVAMDKPRRPQLISSWKTRQHKKVNGGTAHDGTTTRAWQEVSHPEWRLSLHLLY